jgi:putative ABC transport system permease protein
MNLLALAWQLLKRDWHAGELRVLIAALIIAVASISSIGIFTQRINLAMLDQTGRFLGADLLLSAPRPLAEDMLAHATDLSLQTSQAMEFSSVLVAGDNFQLGQIKAVDTAYPLKGEIKLARQRFGDEQAVDHGPAPGEIWINSRLFNSLGIQMGDSVQLGESRLRVSAELRQDPGQASNVIAIAPRVLMHLDDVAATRVVQPGSRLKYQVLFAGPLPARNQFEQWLTPRLNPTQKLIGGKQGSPALNSALDRAEDYLALAAMLSVMLAGIAVAMAANRYSLRHFDQSGLLRCLGIKQNRLTALYALQLLIIGSLASLLGCLLGYLAQLGLVHLLRDLLPGELPAASARPYIIGFISGLITLTGFSLPAVLRLKSVPPLRVLRRDALPMPINAGLVYGLALFSIIGLMWWQSGNLLLTGAVLLGVLVAALLLALLSGVLMALGKRASRHMQGPWLAGLQQLVRHNRASQIQILAFGLALMVLMTILLLRTDLISRWQAKLPDRAPNHFMINVQADEVADIEQLLQRQGIASEGLYPMVRGRITHINEVPVMQTRSADAKQDNALKRELNLSWAAPLQDNNKITAGRWWRPDDRGQLLMSVEEELAQRLGIGLGDSLSFRIGARSLTARVASLRSVQWDSFQPNFFIIFPPGVLEDYPSSYISSFYLPASEKAFINTLVKQHPGVTVIELDAIMNQVKIILTQVTIAVEYVMLFVLLAGITVLLAALQSSMDERLHNTTILRTLGARKDYIRKTLLAEFCLLGLFAGIIAVLGSELGAWVMYSRVFNLDYSPHAWMWIAGPASGMLFITAAGYLSTRKVMHQAPMKTLQEI